MRLLCLLAAVLMISGCAPSQIQYVPRAMPPLDSGLAAPCPPIPDPPQEPADYDAWQAWVQDQVLVLWGVCAARHRETVAAWPK
jgi:hypothetical protein